MAQPNILLAPGKPIPSGYIVGRVSPGTGQAELISLADISRQVVALGIVGSPGAPTSLVPIADQRFLANRSGGTAAPVATPFTDIDTVGTLTTGTWSAGTVGSSTNSSGSRPASTTTAGWKITSNYDGLGSVDFWSTVNAAGSQGFAFWQKTGSGSEINICRAYADGTFMEFDFLANASGTVGGYFFVDATGFYLGENSGVPDFYFQASNLGHHYFQVNGSTIATIDATGFTGNAVVLNGATSGTVTLKAPAVAGTRTVTFPAGTTDFSATGPGAVKQASAGAAFTVGTLPVDAGGTGQTSYTDGQLLIGNTTGNTLTKATITAGSNITVTNGHGSITIAATGTSGLAGGANHDVQINSGGGLGGITLTDGKVLIGSTGADPVAATLTAGNGVAITNGAGSISIAADHYLYNISAGVPTIASMTAVNVSGTTSSNENSGRGFAVVDTGKNTTSLAGYTKAVPGATPYMVALLVMCVGSAGMEWCFGWGDGTKYETIGFVLGAAPASNVETWTNSTTRNGFTTLANYGFGPAPVWIGLHDDGTNRIFKISSDGKNFITINSAAKSGAWLGGSGYSNIFMGLRPATTAPGVMTCICYDTAGLSRTIR